MFNIIYWDETSLEIPMVKWRKKVGSGAGKVKFTKVEFP